MENKNLAPQKKQSDSLSKWTSDEQKHIGLALARIFDAQKQYGKTPEQITNITACFCWALGKYPVDAVLDGLAVYITRHNDMPTPSDIVKIIDPQPEPWRPDKGYYIRLQQIFKEQGPYGLTLEEIEYIRKYEARMQTEIKEAR